MCISRIRYKNIDSVILILFLVLLSACDTSFRIEKVSSDNTSITKIYETYLVSNVSNIPEEKYSILQASLKNRFIQLCEKDTFVNEFSVDFYEDIYCTRNYYKRIEQLRGAESLIEKCEDYYYGSFLYKRSKEKPYMWYLSYPTNLKDTIYCK
ncbi:hypothetical protein [Aquimarina algicola]|uniref:Lipoprotein n=1 Tax=Aquimarina algicola TaxID=2589995 RepID=A0A504JH55_9FLAO|nr:hypothetical protein [Aquimarina algicola]TPN88032.1 hypothetical protein FHK87_10700 [Aquimarina algicola]